MVAKITIAAAYTFRPRNRTEGGRQRRRHRPQQVLHRFDQSEANSSGLSAGSGTSLVVADAGFFYDGFGIVGETGDAIQLEGQTETAQVVSIDYATNTLTLDAPLTWTAGLGVSLAYDGDAPDVGMSEAN